MDNFKYVIIAKNRGWRGLAETTVIDSDHYVQLRMVYSFSEKVWEDLIIHHKTVIQDNDYYYVITVEDDDCKLPRQYQQRSVLIKNVMLKITNVNRYEKHAWTSADPEDYQTLVHFMKNTNNHTQSDWNCIGLRVIPEI